MHRLTRNAEPRALQLDEAERAHLMDLARAANPNRTANRTALARRRPAEHGVRPAVQRILDAVTGAPAFVRNGRLDILAANPLGQALYSEIFADPVRPANSARFLFLDRRATRFFVDWERAAGDTVAILRGEAGRNPYDLISAAMGNGDHDRDGQRGGGAAILTPRRDKVGLSTKTITASKQALSVNGGSSPRFRATRYARSAVHSSPAAGVGHRDRRAG